jgi:uncharacterized Zn-finger protein
MGPFDCTDTFDFNEYVTIDCDVLFKNDEHSSSDESIESPISYTNTFDIPSQNELLLPLFTGSDPIYMTTFESSQSFDHDLLFTKMEYNQSTIDFYQDFKLEPDPLVCPAVDNTPTPTEPEFSFPDQPTIDELSKTMDGDELIKTLWSPEMYGRKYENGRNWYSCHICQKLFTRSVNLKSHVVSDHWKLRPIKCPVASCSARFARKHDCKRHVRLVHQH